MEEGKLEGGWAWDGLVGYFVVRLGQKVDEGHFVVHAPGHALVQPPLLAVPAAAITIQTLGRSRGQGR